MTTTTPLRCKDCGAPDDLRCDCAESIHIQGGPHARRIDALLAAIRAGYYVIDGREAPTPVATTR